jgi:hypothetical protein
MVGFLLLPGRSQAIVGFRADSSFRRGARHVRGTVAVSPWRARSLASRLIRPAP